MQTFLPYEDFKKSAKVLDKKRLGKQIVETEQIYKALTIKEYGWKNHPIVKMWKGHEQQLLLYGKACYDEWKERYGREHKSGERILDNLSKLNTGKLPSWIGNQELHASHRSNLLRKDYSFYSKFKWTEKDNLPYVWIV